MSDLMQIAFYFIILLVLAYPLGIYCSKVMDGERVFLSPVMAPVENFIYKILHINPDLEMSWKRYGANVLVFNALGVAVLYAILIFQEYLPLNSEHIHGMSWDLALNTAFSFVTNCNWQAYSGEMQASYFTQMFGFTTHNFASPAAAIAVLFAAIRGLRAVRGRSLGNFWQDFVRIIIYILLPMSIVVAVLLAANGCVQNFKPYTETELLRPAVVEVTGDDGVAVTKTITKAVVPQGPAAGQIAIKEIGTNGGGYFGVNSAHPLENPNQFTNFMELILVLLLPVALCFTFGRALKDMKQGVALFSTMFIVLLLGTAVIYYNESQATVQLLQNGGVAASGNMEGKEVRAGIATTSLWIGGITATSNGSVNGMIDSFTPLGVCVAMLNIMLGEIIFGGVGCGLYGMLGYVLLAVFLEGLLVGRTPEYLGKKLGEREVIIAIIMCLTIPAAILIGSAVAVMWPSIGDSLTNSGARGFSEILYAYCSAGGNNGSALGGFAADKPFINITLTILIIVGRYVPMIGALALAGSLAPQVRIPESEGTLKTNNTMFVIFLLMVILVIGALGFLPALSLGPILEYLQTKSM